MERGNHAEMFKEDLTIPSLLILPPLLALFDESFLLLVGSRPKVKLLLQGHLRLACMLLLPHQVRGLHHHDLLREDGLEDHL